jgi:hypothetical protein
MLFVNTAEDLANPLGELVSTEYPLGLDHLALAVGTHFGSMALSHGLFLGNKQGTLCALRGHCF